MAGRVQRSSEATHSSNRSFLTLGDNLQTTSTSPSVVLGSLSARRRLPRSSFVPIAARAAAPSGEPFLLFFKLSSSVMCRLRRRSALVSGRVPARWSRPERVLVSTRRRRRRVPRGRASWPANSAVIFWQIRRDLRNIYRFVLPFG